MKPTQIRVCFSGLAWSNRRMELRRLVLKSAHWIMIVCFSFSKDPRSTKTDFQMRKLWKINHYKITFAVNVPRIFQINLRNIPSFLRKEVILCKMHNHENHKAIVTRKSKNAFTFHIRRNAWSNGQFWFGFIGDAVQIYLQQSVRQFVWRVHWVAAKHTVNGNNKNWQTGKNWNWTSEWASHFTLDWWGFDWEEMK